MQQGQEWDSPKQEASPEQRGMEGSQNPLEGDLGNGPKNPGSDQTVLFLSGCSKTRDSCAQNKWSLKMLLHRYKRVMQNLSDKQDSEVTKKQIAILVTLTMLLLISIGLNIHLAAKRQRLLAALSQKCPEGWVRSEGRCYYFSATKETWDAGQDFCSSYGGSLVTMDTSQERDFVMNLEDLDDYWIGLRREGGGQTWKPSSGSLLTNWFPVGGEGLCAHLNFKEVRSTQCASYRRWICSKPIGGSLTTS